MSPTATARTRAGAVAPAHRPDPRPAHRPGVRQDPAPQRRHLRPVPAPETTREEPPRRRRIRPQVALTMAIGAFFAILFGVALLQTILVQGQIRLDGLRADVTELQAEAQVLREDVARHESPENIIGVATTDLGLVVDEDVDFVQQAPQADATDP